MPKTPSVNCFMRLSTMLQLYKRCEGNFSFNQLIKFGFESFSSEKDAQEMEKFFKDKDTSKFNLALAQVNTVTLLWIVAGAHRMVQTLDSIRASAKWLNRSRDDVAQWFNEWKTNTRA